MNKKLIVEKTKEFCKNKLLGEGSGHDWYHVERVYNNALDIAKHEDGVDIFIVELGALLHDIADHKFGYSDEDREDIISEFLLDLNVERKIIDAVVYIANYISFKGGKNKHKMQTIEGEVVQDADRLDAMGAIGIGRTFAYGGYKNRVMYDPENTESNEDTISHFYEKLLLLKNRMNTSYGKLKAERRHETMQEFLDNFYSE